MTEEKALFDPLWEYILDDYEEEEQKRRLFFGRNEAEVDTSPLLDVFPVADDSTTDTHSTIQRDRSWTKSFQREKSSGSLLDFFERGGDSESENGIKKKTSWSTKSEEKSSGFLLDIFDHESRSDTGLNESRSWGSWGQKRIPQEKQKRGSQEKFFPLGKQETGETAGFLDVGDFLGDARQDVNVGSEDVKASTYKWGGDCLLYTSPSPRD